MKAEVIPYEELFFPQVETLPRDLPLLIPLGETSDYDWDKTADRVLARTRSVSVPDRVCVFPAVPYGFRGSSLEVDPTLFKRVMQSLIATLKDDGFTNVQVINGYGPQGFSTISIKRRGEPRVRPFSPTADQVALIPTGHTEQHAFHLPLSTDTLIIDAIARGVAAKLPDTILRLPTWPYGVSMHRRQYPGTLTIEPRAWEDFFVAVVGRLRERGLRMAYLINGHGGNHSFLVNITKFCGDRWPDIFVATSFLHTTSDALTQIRTSRIGGMGHAGELETSYILQLRPDLVNMDRAVDEVDFTATPNYYMDWLEGGALIANPPWTDDTISGAYGAATHGTAEKGRLWLEAAIDEKIGHVHEIIEQQRRREERHAEGWVTGSWRKRLEQQR
jgi:creatinine amidohydrolase